MYGVYLTMHSCSLNLSREDAWAEIMAETIVSLPSLSFLSLSYKQI
jgi:hypothetical protein